jgi:DnaJ-class molecular chaperone
MIRPGRACPGCAGKKVVPVRRSFDVRLPRGIPDGHAHIIQGKGSFDPKSKKCGDVRLEFRYLQCDNVTFEGDDVVLKVPVSLEEVLCGFQRTVSPWNVPIKLLAKGYFDPRKEGRFPSKGLPKYRKTDKFMDLIVRFEVTYPDRSTFASAKDELVKRMSTVVEVEEGKEDLLLF